MSNTLMTDNGIIRFYDGTVIAIEDQEYSPDGKYNWEKIFNPNDHLSSLDGITPVEGHKYKRVKHSGDTSFQMPYRIVPDDPEFRVQDNILQWKLEEEDDTKWRNLLDIEILQGEDGKQGEKGIPGEGFHIDQYGYIKLRPDCSSALNQSSCTSCNNTGSNSSEASTFMSLGDGVLILTQALITAGTVTVDTVAYSHFSNDLITWNAISSGIVDFEARYLATDGTGTVYTDMRTEDYYSSRGIVYVCADGRWTVLTNIATPSYMVGESAGSTNIGYLDNFVNVALTDSIVDTIGLNGGKLEVVEQSINEDALNQTVAGDGLEIPLAKDPIQVKSSDFAGFGLTNYVSDTDSLSDLQVLVDDLLSDGLAVQSGIAVDGETANLIKVKPSDLINNNSGIIATVQGDAFEDLSVNLGNGLQLDGNTPQAITIDVDNSSLEVNATDLHIKQYTSGNDGVRLLHLNPDIIWDNRGVGLDTANGIYARIDNLTIGYDGAGNLEVPFNAITGDRLNDNVADNTKGIEVLNDMLAVKVDGSTVDFNGSGELTYVGAAGMYVSSITAGGTTVKDDVIFNVTSSDGSINPNLTATINPASDTIDLVLNVSTAWLDAYLVSNPPAGFIASWGTITGTITDQTDLVNYINGLGHVELDTWYNDTMISASNGLVLRATSGENFRVIVDANGNLDTVQI